MDLVDAKKYLDACVRSELRDHAFGDSEVFWEKDGIEWATGYFGSGTSEVSFSQPYEDGFYGEDAHELRKCGTKGQIERNDETGPDTYSEGATMPGLTLEGVRQEITGA